jgi:hypothetical protein
VSVVFAPSTVPVKDLDVGLIIASFFYIASESV